jgi:hypothetical protein
VTKFGVKFLLLLFCDSSILILKSTQMDNRMENPLNGVHIKPKYSAWEVVNTGSLHPMCFEANIHKVVPVTVSSEVGMGPIYRRTFSYLCQTFSSQSKVPIHCAPPHKPQHSYGQTSQQRRGVPQYMLLACCAELGFNQIFQGIVRCWYSLQRNTCLSHCFNVFLVVVTGHIFVIAFPSIIIVVTNFILPQPTPVHDSQGSLVETLVGLKCFHEDHLNMKTIC